MRRQLSGVDEVRAALASGDPPRLILAWRELADRDALALCDEARAREIEVERVSENDLRRMTRAGPTAVLLALCGRLNSSGYYKDVVTTKFGDWFMYDLGIATQTLCLAAHKAGLGTVVVGLFDHDRAGKLINLPEGVELVSLIPIGYPAKTGSAPKRREVSEFMHSESF